ncbi:MAG: GTP-binding protein, partial [Candidatus Methanarcanum hacksteinii]|nr:GTP-binding protein [Candidatus Methanarcanum hacksteinii]
MIIHVVGGFLGSGKTTLLIKIAERYIADGKKVTILVNEAGEIGVDGASISSNGLNAIQLQEGCICCTLSGTLQSTMRDI